MQRLLTWLPTTVPKTSLGLKAVNMAKRRTFTAPFNAKVAKEVLHSNETVRQAAVKQGVRPNYVSQRKRKASDGLVQLFEQGTNGGQDKQEVEICKVHERLPSQGGALIAMMSVGGRGVTERLRRYLAPLVGASGGVHQTR